MMAWLSLALLMLAGAALAWFMGARRGFLTATAAALVFGAAGYALQGSPGLAGAPAQAAATRSAISLTEARHAFFGQFTAAESWMRISEALARDGQFADSAGILQNAVKRYPGDPQLWVGLGNALVEQGRGLSPPAELAYRRASEIAPGHPAPGFFYGLALARSGDRQGALRMWRSVLADAPANASWRPLVEQGVAALSQARAAPAPHRPNKS
jgi:cytochrome c-type biogenesis protein CcmH